MNELIETGNNYLYQVKFLRKLKTFRIYLI